LLSLINPPEGSKAMLKHFVLTVFFCLLISSSVILGSIHSVGAEQVANGANLVWEKTFGGSGDDRAYAALAVSDGFLIVGSSASFGSQTVPWVLKLDSSGTMIWNQTYPQTDSAEFRCVLSLPDGFLLVGNELSENSNGLIVKINSQGVIQWNTTISSGVSSKLWSAVSTQDGFALAGFVINGDHNNFWAATINQTGGLVWSKTYGGTVDCTGRAIAVGNDGSLVIAGYASTADNDYDFLAVKIDASGNMLWNKTYGGTESDKAYAITSDAGNFVIAGDTRSKGAGDCDAWIVKIDSSGNLVWDKTVGDTAFDEATCITEASDGGYLVGGWTISYGNGQRDFWLFKLSSVGELSWSATVGRSDYEEAYAVIQTGENQFVMAGWTKSIGNGYYDFYVTKIEVASSNWLQSNWVMVVAIIVTVLILGVIVARILSLRHT
jgi:hypothetical protein